MDISILAVKTWEPGNAHFSHYIVTFLLRFDLALELVLLEARIPLSDYALDRGELASLLLDAL